MVTRESDERSNPQGSQIDRLQQGSLKASMARLLQTWHRSFCGMSAWFRELTFDLSSARKIISLLVLTLQDLGSSSRVLRLQPSRRRAGCGIQGADQFSWKMLSLVS